MRKIIYKIFVTLLVGTCCVACYNDDDTNEKIYKEWREFNAQWLVEQMTRTNPDGTPYYSTCALPTDPQSFVLMHRIGEEHSENLTPLFTSTTKVNYTLTLANDSVMDQTAGFVSQLNSTNLIAGWSIAIMQLHVGDSAQFVVPYGIGYGASGNGFGIDPYSNLVFNIKLVDIEAYEVRP